jgi:DNA (cytosine-5)-methyltransferase 1
MVAIGSELQPWHRRAERLAEEGADFISAGFPCQDISFAGAGAGLAGARSGLVWPLLRTIRLVRPRSALLENVAALLGRGLGSILGHMAEVGYDAEWHCIPASAVGAPHQRDRIWILLADADCERAQVSPAGYEPAQPITRSTGAHRPSTHATPVLGPEVFRRQPDRDFAGVGSLADAESDGRIARRTRDASQGPRGRQSRGGGISQDLRNANVSGLALGQGQSRDVGEEFSPSFGADWWSAEPDVGRVADGVPARVDRLRCLGNAVVPQVVEMIGRAILEAQKP